MKVLCFVLEGGIMEVYVVASFDLIYFTIYFKCIVLLNCGLVLNFDCFPGFLVCFYF